MSSLDRHALAIVEQCLELEAAERDRLIEERCASAPELRAKVRRILEMDQASFRLLPTGAMAPSARAADPIPERIGAFRIVETIGSGGMGTVVRAEPTTGSTTRLSRSSSPAAS